MDALKFYLFSFLFERMTTKEFKYFITYSCTLSKYGFNNHAAGTVALLSHATVLTSVSMPFAANWVLKKHGSKYQKR